MNKKYIFSSMLMLFIGFSLTSNVFSKFAANDFLISPKKNEKQIKSKRRLKEKIGLNVKDSLNLFSDLTKTIGKIQSKTASIQKELFAKIENLIDNKKPFKKASRANLNSSLMVVKKINLNLKRQLRIIKEIKKDLDADICLKKDAA